MLHKKACFKFASTFIALLAISFPALAQAGEEVWYADGFGHFIVAIIAGILLAFAFQFLLTNLAVAMGINMIGDVREMGNDSESTSNYSETDDSDSTPTGVKISSGMGIFMLLTMTVSVFFASLIAVKLTLTASNTVGFTLGLVIWAGYLLLGLYLDSKFVSSLTGSIFDAVKTSLSAGGSAIGGIFGKSKSEQFKETAVDTVKSIQQEVAREYDMSGIEQKLDEYVNKLKPQRFDINTIEEKVAELVNDIQVKEKYTPENPEAIKELVLEVASEQPAITAEDKQMLSSAFGKIKSATSEGGSRADKAMSAVDKLTPGSEEQSKEYRQKIEQYLRNTNEEELQPEKLKQDLNEILNNPKAAPEVVEARASKMDRSTMKSLISNVQGMNEQKAERYLDKATEVLDSIKSKAHEMQSGNGHGGNEYHHDGFNRMDGSGASEQNKEKAKDAVRQWFNRMDEPELRFDALKHDARRIMDDPKAAPKVLRNRLERMDRDSLLALVSNNKSISREQAEHVVDRIEEGREEVLNKANEIERKVKDKIAQARRQTMKQLEATRKTAAAAAWWMFLAVVVSGGASALGGMLALT